MSQASAPVLGWRLPKTLLDVTVTYVPATCTNVAGEDPNLKVSAKVAIVPRGAPDLNLGDAYPNGLVSVREGNLDSFWVDSNFTYKLIPGRGGLLQSLSSHSVGQGGAIISNVLTGIVKIAAAVAGPKPLAGPNVCGTVIGTIATLRKKIAAEAGKQATDDATALQNLITSVTITETLTVDPAAVTMTTPVPGDFTQSWIIGRIKPTDEHVAAAGWYGPGAAAIGSIRPDQHVTIFLDFSHAILLPHCADGKKLCDRDTTKLPATNDKGDALFRQAAYVPVFAMKGEPATAANPAAKQEALGEPQSVAFGQYGAVRSLPVKVGYFKDVNWEVDFTELGEVTTGIYASKAQGVGITSALAGAATAASTIQASNVAAQSAVDSDTLRLQAENAAIKAQVDNKTLKAQLNALDAAAPQ